MSRLCVKDFQLPDTDITIKKGQEIYISIIGIHLDDRYYPDPLKFNPENVSEENCGKRSPYTILGFGQGPHACIGKRFAFLEAKVALVCTLKKLQVPKVSPNTGESS